MKGLVGLLALLMVASAWADDASDTQSEVKIRIAYMGMGQFYYKKKQYDYNGLLAAIQADYQGVHVTDVSVDMGELAPVSDTLRVCQLKRDLGALVEMHFVVGSETREQFCS